MILCGWIAVRTALLWPQSESLPDALRKAVPIASLLPRAAEGGLDMGFVEPRALQVPVLRAAKRGAAAPAPASPPTLPGPAIRKRDPVRVQFALLGFLHYGDPIPVGSEVARPAQVPVQIGGPPRPDRWSGSAWLVVRGGTGLGAAPGAGQLGGAQAGARIAFAPRPGTPIALFARATTPLRETGSEAALGVEYRPGSAPIRLVVEQRFAIDGGTGGPGLGAVTWLDTTLPHGVRVEAYGQAGAVFRDRPEPYADGAMRTSRAVGGRALPLSLGAGAWGGAQRDAARLDIGPSAIVALPIGGRPVRASLDWRQRIAGDARPGSGLVLTLGTDF